MASSPGLSQSVRALVSHQLWSRRALALSGSLHALLFALAGWATRGGHQGPPPMSPEHVTRAYAVHYLVLVRPPSRPGPRPERRSASRLAPVASVTFPAIPPSTATVAASGIRSEPRRSPVQMEELVPGSITGIGKIIPTPGSDATPGRGLAGMLGFRGPGPGQAGPPRRGPDRVAQLVGRVGSACPEFRRPAGGANRHAGVAVAFVVDTNGTVDPETLRVIESLNRPPNENRFHSHIYAVGARVRVDGDRIEPAAYDSVLRHEVTSHVASLVFRPALRQGRAIRSTVLVSCQTS
jgi:hypothetical protein